MIQFDSLWSVTLNPSLNEHEDFTVYSLWTSKPTPHTTQQSREQKQGQSTYDQKSGQIDKVLWIQDQGKEVKPTCL